MGIDTGSKTSTFCVVDINNKVSVVHSDMFKIAFEGLSSQEFEDKLEAFVVYMSDMLDEYKPDLVKPELYLMRNFRSHLGGPISLMIGIIGTLCVQRGIKFDPEMPAAWKKDLEKTICRVDDLYDTSLPVKNRLPNHPVDALMLALYGHPRGYRWLTKSRIEKLIGKIKKYPPLKASISRLHELELERKRVLAQKKRKKKKTKPRSKRSTSKVKAK